MLNWLSQLFKQKPAVHLNHEEASLLDELIDIADPKIRLADHYLQQLGPLFLAARDQVRKLVLQAPEAIELTPENWRSDALLGCAFASPERMTSIVNADQRLREWFSAHPLEDHVFAILSMTHERAARFGMEEESGMVRQDVPQKVLVLREHRFSRPADSFDALGHLACHRALEELAAHAARRIHGVEEEKTRIEDEINTLRITLRLNGGPGDEFTASAEQRARQVRLEKLQLELTQVREALAPERRLAALEAVLHDPEQQLRVAEIVVHIDMLGVIRPAGPQSRPVTLTEIEVMAEEPVRRVLVPVGIPRSLLRMPAENQDFFGSAIL